MPSSAWLAAVAVAAIAAPAQSQNVPFRYRGLCEASAAMIVGPNRFAVASDDSEIIRIYERGKAEPLAGLDLPVGEVGDFEAAAISGDRLYWTTSHSLTKDGEDKAKRKQLIETSMAGGRLAVVGRRVDLRTRISTLLAPPEWPLREPPEWPLEASLNIEGMAGSPRGDLLLGLRAPLKGGKAAVLRISDPHRLTSGSATAAAAGNGIKWLNLGQRGIRSLEGGGMGARAYLILAGATGESKQEPALFWWDGMSSNVTAGPTLVAKNALPDGEGLPSRDVVPEAVIRWKDGTIQVLGDNEANCTEGGNAWFPSLEIRP
ncbi:MAG TPA: hypothetical protein VE891_09760 [Allosphingosinicella sp.]|nr:hypothetical protein [Allosphingosinicella sp.]